MLDDMCKYHQKAAKVLAAIFMIFYLTERKFVVLFLDRVTGYEPVGRGFESLLAHQVTRRDGHCSSRLFLTSFVPLNKLGCQLYNVGRVPVQNTLYLV
ncbi:hypothetical protein DW964_07730 [Ruminococcus sp. AM47-2BH]|nr:hypothetical protein DW964_07730 [Ruminococcus sp. AM47-2BH]